MQPRPPRRHRTRSLKLGLAAAALVALAVLGAVAPVREWLAAFDGWLAGLGPLGAVVFGLLYVAATVALLPGSALTLAAGVAFGLWAFPVVVVAATIGASAAFLIGRHVARDAVSRRLAHHPRFRAVDAAVGREGWKVVGLMRLSPLVPFNLQNYLFGLTEVRFSHYAWATFFGIMPGSLLYVYFGAAGRAALATAGTDAGADAGRGPLQVALLALGLLATLAVTVVVTRAARRQLAAVEETPSGPTQPGAAPGADRPGSK